MNTSPHTPDTTPNPPTPTAPTAPAGRRSNWVFITTAIVGGVVLVGAIGAAALSGFAAITKPSNESPQSLTADASDMKKIEVDASAAHVSIDCHRDGAHADELAVLTASEGVQRWYLHMDRDTLRVGAERGPFGWFGNLNLFGLGAWEPQTVSISLPEEACVNSSLNADFDLSSGRLVAEGVYDALTLEVSAGEARVGGAARTVNADVSAGSAHLELSDVVDARLQVSAGGLFGEFDGAAPDRVRVDVSAGELDLALPDAHYLVASDVAAGNFDNLLRTGGGTAGNHQIEVDVSAGKVTLRPGR